MKKPKVLLLFPITFALLIGGCSQQKPVPQVIVEPIIETPAPEQPVEAKPAELGDTPPAEGMVRSRLTNEWIDEAQNNMRPIAVMIPNSSTASQYGISDADILYEINVEGDMTRLMAIIDNWQDKEKIGNIRSGRDYFTYWSFEWDSIFIHYGGPFYIYDVIGRKDTDNIDCISQPDIGKYNNAYTDLTYREQAKNDSDNAFTSADRIKEACSDLGISLEYREGYSDPEHFKFAPAGSPNTLEQYPSAFKAEKIDFSEAYPMTNSYLVYDEETGLYARYQHFIKGTDEPHIDLSNNEQLKFKNVLVQNTYYEVRDQKGYLAFRCHDTTHDGWYFTNGKGIHVTWEKKSDYGATRYYDDKGMEIELNNGKTMICIIEEGDKILVDGKSYQGNVISVNN